MHVNENTGMGVGIAGPIYYMNAPPESSRIINNLLPVVTPLYYDRSCNRSASQAASSHLRLATLQVMQIERFSIHCIDLKYQVKARTCN